MKSTVKDFFSTETYSVERGYTVHISRSPEFASEAVVEDDDGICTLIDVSDVPWKDQDDFIDVVIERYESLHGSAENWMTASEADERWGKPAGSVRVACNRGRFDEQIERGIVRKSGGTWLVTEQAMKEIYGNPKEELENA